MRLLRSALLRRNRPSAVSRYISNLSACTSCRRYLERLVSLERGGERGRRGAGEGGVADTVYRHGLRHTNIGNPPIHTHTYTGPYTAGVPQQTVPHSLHVFQGIHSPVPDGNVRVLVVQQLHGLLRREGLPVLQQAVHLHRNKGHTSLHTYTTCPLIYTSRPLDALC